MYRNLLLAFLFGAPLLALAADRPDPQVHLVEEIVAKVNGEIITRSELTKRRDYIKVDDDLNRKMAAIQSDSKISDPEKFHEWLQEQLGGVAFEDFKQQQKNK